MKTTNNLGLKKIELTDSPADITVQDLNWDLIDKHLYSAVSYQKAGGTGTAITLSDVTLVDGFSKTFIVTTANAGAATTINGKPLYKTGTTLAPSITAGNAVTVWYHHTGDCFFIKNDDFQILTTLAQIGLTAGTETMQAIGQAMPDYSMLVWQKLTTNASLDYPKTSGVLTVIRYSQYRVEFRFIYGATGSVSEEYFGYGDNNITPWFTGWKKNISTSDVDLGSLSSLVTSISALPTIAIDLNTIIVGKLEVWRTTDTTLNTPYKQGLLPQVAGICLSYANTASYCIQLFMPTGNINIYTRMKSNGTWSEWSRKSIASTKTDTTLTAASWVGTAAPFTYTLAVTGVTSVNYVEILPQATLTSAQAMALSSAQVLTGTQATNSITLKAFGKRPAIDIPITIIIRGDV